jgi:hypothetical protein
MTSALHYIPTLIPISDYGCPGIARRMRNATFFNQIKYCKNREKNQHANVPP